MFLKLYGELCHQRLVKWVQLLSKVQKTGAKAPVILHRCTGAVHRCTPIFYHKRDCHIVLMCGKYLLLVIL